MSQDSNWCEEIELRPILEIRQKLISVAWM